MSRAARRAWNTLPEPGKAAAKRVYAGYARATSGDRLLPDYLIIGTQRGGTTSLYKYLVQHPSLAHAMTKELRFFDLNYQRGVGWYRSRFPTRTYRRLVRSRGGELVVGEGSPDYLFHPLVPRRVRGVLPHVKLIVLLRDPVDRAVSHYWHQFKRGHETLSFEDAIQAEPARLAGELEKIVANPGYVSAEWHHHSYLSRGRYANQLEAWFELFPREQFLIEQSEEFFARPALVYGRVLEFLGVPPVDLPQYETFNAFRSGEIDPGLRARLAEGFEPDNHRLYALLGRSFGWNGP
jgi:sulfotransferase family protein